MTRRGCGSWGSHTMASVARKLSLSALLLGLAFAGSGCTHPCLALAEKLCDCQGNQLEVEQCKQQQRRLYDQARQSDLDAAAPVCAERLDTCDCSDLTTEAGKQACGLSQ